MKLLKQIGKYLLVSKLALVAVLAVFVVPLAAFEAHVINVTATIENRTQCDAVSLGYWKSHDGCDKGGGESVWASQIRQMTRNFSGAFYEITGEGICQAVWISDCPKNGLAGKLCKAKAITLADELNLVAGRLDLNALIAGADDGNSAFDRLGLNYNSTIKEALTKIEMIITNSHSAGQQLADAAYVAERIYSFYEDENNIAPRCVYTPKPVCGGGVKFSASSQTGGSDGGFSDEDENSSNEPDRHDDQNKYDDSVGLSGATASTSTDENANTDIGASSDSEISASSTQSGEIIDSATASSTGSAAEPVEATTTDATSTQE